MQYVRVREEKENTISGGNIAQEPPVPIPNTEVKLRRADDTYLETGRENRTLPDPICRVTLVTRSFLCLSDRPLDIPVF